MGAPGCFLRFDSTRFVTNGFAHGISGSPSCLGRPFDLYKANVSEEELQLATSLEEKLGMKMVARRKLTLSDGETERCIIAFEKYQDPAIKLPRKTGIAQKRPLKP